MRILFLDDDEARHQAFAQVASEHEVHHVYTAEDAIENLEDRKFDAVCLDCDLEKEHYDGDYVKGRMAHSGRHVARWIAEHGPKDIDVLIHTYNPSGGREMHNLLFDGGVRRITRCPFSPAGAAGWLHETERIHDGV